MSERILRRLRSMVRNIVLDSDTDVTCIWDNGRYILSISGNLDKETVIDLCKSTKLQK